MMAALRQLKSTTFKVIESTVTGAVVLLALTKDSRPLYCAY